MLMLTTNTVEPQRMFGKPILQNAQVYVQVVSSDLSLAFILFLFILSSSHNICIVQRYFIMCVSYYKYMYIKLHSWIVLT